MTKNIYSNDLEQFTFTAIKVIILFPVHVCDSTCYMLYIHWQRSWLYVLLTAFLTVRFIDSVLDCTCYWLRSLIVRVIDSVLAVRALTVFLAIRVIKCVLTVSVTMYRYQRMRQHSLSEWCYMWRSRQCLRLSMCRRIHGRTLWNRWVATQLGLHTDRIHWQLIFKPYTLTTDI